MREILFRGKRVDNGEWVYGYFVKKLDPLFLTEMCFVLVQEYDTSCIDGTLKSEMTWYRVIPETVRQYTGLRDKNGKKVFENDAVNVYSTLGELKTSKGIIKWSNLFMGWTANGKHGLYGGKITDIYEVIGNIHDNPNC